MRTYVPPTKEMMFTLTELAGMDVVAALPGYEAATPDLVEAVSLEHKSDQLSS